MELKRMTGRTVEQDLRISQEDFDRIRSTSKMHKRSLDLAYEILVEGKKLGAVASAHGLKKQRALAIRDKVYANYLRLTPQGWGVAQICAPEEMLRRFINEAESARQMLWQSRMSESVIEDPKLKK
jgi:hypothetical protein